MGFGNKKGGDVVLESRHVIGMFLLVVVISGIVFTLGYVLGRNQQGVQARIALKDPSPAAGRDSAPANSGVTPAKAQPIGTTPAPSDWDSFRPAEPSKREEAPKAGKTASAASKPGTQAKPSPQSAAANTKGKPLLNAPLIPRGAVVLQVAALTREGDALALAEALQQKKFPAFVLTPGADHYYRVQVGPFGDAQSANMAKRALENEGFKSIVRR